MTYKNNGWLKAVLLVVLLYILASCGAGKKSISGSKTSETLQDDIIQYGRQYLGKPYKYAAKGPNSFDCSGYTSFVFKKFGYNLDPSSAGQDRQLPSIARKKDIRKGDLVFFEGRRRNGNVGHVGIVTETFSNGQFKFIHASTNRGVVISSSNETYYAQRYLRGGRILEQDASYATRQNKLPDNAKLPVVSTVTNNKSLNQDIPEITLPRANDTTTVTACKQAEEGSGKGEEPIIIVQTDPLKNPPLSQQQPASNGKREEKDTLKASNEIAMMEENLEIPLPTKSHTVLMGETLYSISKQYGCSVEQLKEWNPQMGSVLKAGEKLHIF